MTPTLSFPPEVVALCRRLQAAGYAAYMVGGAVRDKLRMDFFKDYDIATSARPAEVQAVFADLRVIPTGIDHGTVTLMVPWRETPEPLPVEVTTFRSEGGYSDGRRPDSVEFIGDIVEDLRRRDFTINAIAYDPVAEVLVDPFDGLGDIERRTIRAVGDPAARFREDGLRVMRAVRFAARFKYAIDPSTWGAIPDALDTLRKVSRERIRDEVQKILDLPSDRAFHGLDLLTFSQSSLVLEAILPDLAPYVRMADGSRGTWVGFVSSSMPAHRWGAFLWPMRRLVRERRMDRKATARYLFEQLRLPGAACEAISWVICADLPVLDETLGSVRRFLAAHPGDQEGISLWLHLGMRSGDLDDPEVRAYKALHRRILDARFRAFPLRVTDLDVSGANLISDLGLEPGPRVGETLRALHDWALEDPDRNKRPLLLAEARRRLTA